MDQKRDLSSFWFVLGFLNCLDTEILNNSFSAFLVKKGGEREGERGGEKEGEREEKERESLLMSVSEGESEGERRESLVVRHLEDLGGMRERENGERGEREREGRETILRVDGSIGPNEQIVLSFSIRHSPSQVTFFCFFSLFLSLSFSLSFLFLSFYFEIHFSQTEKRQKEKVIQEIYRRLLSAQIFFERDTGLFFISSLSLFSYFLSLSLFFLCDKNRILDLISFIQK